MRMTEKRPSKTPAHQCARDGRNSLHEAPGRHVGKLFFGPYGFHMGKTWVNPGLSHDGKQVCGTGRGSSSVKILMAI